MERSEGAPSEGTAGVAALDERRHHAQMPPPVRTHPPAATLDAASNSGATLAAAGDANGEANGLSTDAADMDSWMSGPFRSAPLGYVMHSTPSGTPLASPRTATPQQQRGEQGDLEAPLLARPKRRHRQQFESGGLAKAIVFGLINTAAGVVGAGGAADYPRGKGAGTGSDATCRAYAAASRHQLPDPRAVLLVAPASQVGCALGQVLPGHPSACHVEQVPIDHVPAHPHSAQPALIAFCAVVFKHPLYEPYVEPLCKFFFLASAVHQAVVSLRSAVPNAVGQVQVGRGGGGAQAASGGQEEVVGGKTAGRMLVCCPSRPQH